jgi:hypothetical protein
MRRIKVLQIIITVDTPGEPLVRRMGRKLVKGTYPADLEL